MLNHAEVRLSGETVGEVHMTKDDFAEFKYDSDFIAKGGAELSPVMMPLSSKSYCFRELSKAAFHGLPGLLSDSLPDRFGSQLSALWLNRIGKTESDFNIIDRLCYTGKLGMGALEYFPLVDEEDSEDIAQNETEESVAIGERAARKSAKKVNIQKFTDVASIVLSHRQDLSSVWDICALKDLSKELSKMIYLGISAGGARAKAVIAYNPESGEVKTGYKSQREEDSGFEDWLIKFSGLKGNRDKERDDDIDFGKIEFAYYKAALDCGIKMSECRLLDDGKNKHFITKRFDRSADGSKLHMLTLAAMGHYDFNKPGTCGYENVFDILRKIGAPQSDIEQEFRRAVFNVLARNQDDHVKNTAFIMSREGKWYLSPAYDVCFSYNPHGYWTGTHQMTLNKKRDNFNMIDFKACGDEADISEAKVVSIVKEIKSVISNWKDYAKKSGVNPQIAEAIFNTFPLSEI